MTGYVYDVLRKSLEKLEEKKASEAQKVIDAIEDDKTTPGQLPRAHAEARDIGQVPEGSNHDESEESDESDLQKAQTKPPSLHSVKNSIKSASKRIAKGSPRFSTKAGYPKNQKVQRKIAKTLELMDRADLQVDEMHLYLKQGRLDVTISSKYPDVLAQN